MIEQFEIFLETMEKTGKWNPKILPVNYTLNYLLFGESGFMESMEWREEGNEWVLNPHKEYEDLQTQDNIALDRDHDYHKIQLVLLKTDEERVEYLLNNILQ